MVHPMPGFNSGAYFGQPGSLWSLGYHTGTDFPAPVGTWIHAAMGGTVIAANAYDGSYGYKIIVAGDDGNQHWYCHMPAGVNTVGNGARVEAGQHIGQVGATGNITGPHLHLEVRKAPYTFAHGNFLDPMQTIVPYTPEEEDMPLTNDEIQKIAFAVWSYNSVQAPAAGDAWNQLTGTKNVLDRTPFRVWSYKGGSETRDAYQIHRDTDTRVRQIKEKTDTL